MRSVLLRTCLSSRLPATNTIKGNTTAYISPSSMPPRKNSSGFPYHQLPRISLTRKALDDFNRLSTSGPRFQPPGAIPLQEGAADLDALGVDLSEHIASGGPDLSELRGLADMAASPAARSERKSDRKSTTYDPSFEQLLLYCGSYADFNSGRLPKPVNWNYLKNMLRQNPVECAMEDFESFVEKANDMRGETKTIQLLLPLILGDENIPHEQNIPFSNFQPLIDGLVDGKPDFFDGLRASDVQVDIRTSLGHFIVPSKMPGIPVLPNFFLEAKGSDGSPAVVKRQILHDGTLGARAMHTLLAWSRPAESFDDIARTISATFQDGFLQLYTTHCSFQDRAVYYTNLLDIYPLKKSLESFQEGITAIRNARKWAMTERESMISEINNAAIPHTVQIPRDSRLDRHHTPQSLATTSVTVDSQSTDELARPGVTTKKRGSKSATPRKERGVQKGLKKQRK